MGAGKSAVGRQLARFLHMDFVDSDEEIEAAMNGNICRCGTYPRIEKAILKAAQTMKKGGDHA